jgi:type III restriction enzyme
MDKGAHFFKCDFQIHSPRDKQWTGKKIGVSDSELTSLTEEQKGQINGDRRQFAKEYLDKIRLAGLNAIAITDHHDVTFVKIIRQVANEENQYFIDNLETEKIITVFPGIELTLASPVCQCIIIFDSDFDDANLDSVLNFFGIQSTNEYNINTAQTQRISHEIINDLEHFHKKLDELPHFRGKYVLLPNIGKGQDSILRSGFHEHYRKMPCVGGYVDKDIPTETGYLNKLNGGDVHYGNKAVAIISTSDNRFEDGIEFGKYSTWIKWAEPTAEAIRQACLAKESRISQLTPEIPQIYIKSIDVTNSKFLGSFSVYFNQQYNTLIGGRGTGKSTVIEYLRWGLCDQTIQNIDTDELNIIEKRRNSLIQKTLTDFDGEVRITMDKNGILHIVKRNSKTREISIKIGEDIFRQVNEDDVRKLFPIQSYSQKQLSDVGVKTEELKRFVEQPIKIQLEDIKFRLSETVTKIKNSYDQFIRKKGIENEIENINLELNSIKIQIESLRKSLKGISENDQKTLAKKSKYGVEKTIIDNSINEFNIFQKKADELLNLLEIYPEPINVEQVENIDLIQNIVTEASGKFILIKKIANQFKEIFNESSLANFNALIQKWEEKRNDFEKVYEVAQNNSQSSQQQLQEIQKLELRYNEILSIITDRNTLLKEIANPENEFFTQRDKWKQYHLDKIKLLKSQAYEFTNLSKNLIRAEVTKNINLQNFKSILKNIFEGSRIREERIDSIIEYIIESNDPLNEYLAVLEEFKLLSEINISNEKTLNIPETPILTGCGFSDDQRLKIYPKMSKENWLNLSTNELDFYPTFFYTTNSSLGDEIPFAEASAGQQATALLTVLLNQPGIPLLIDQPEDDIDNKAIESIIKNIWEAKKKRQLIFTSHNANMVVNGDSELVICCDYKDSSSQTRGIIKSEGAIDKKIIRDEITAVMEGGEKAFKLRKEKYGF